MSRTAKHACPNCFRGFVCEEHPDKPWHHDGCQASGMPCPMGVAERSMGAGVKRARVHAIISVSCPHACGFKVSAVSTEAAMLAMDDHLKSAAAHQQAV